MTPEIDSSAASLYATMASQAGSQKLLISLERIAKACNALEKQGTPITVAAVGHECVEMFGGPKIQSIRNSKDTLALYIQRRAGEQQGVTPTAGVATNRPTIENESVRAYVRTLEVQLEQANNELRRVKAGLRQLQPLDTQGIGNLLGDDAPVAPVGQADIPEQAKADLRQFLDPQRLASCGIKEVAGELEFASGLVLLQKDGLAELKDLTKQS